MTLREWARQLKRDVMATWIAARDPRVAWYVKLLAGAVAAYAVSPIDLIPDFIPVLGYLDDLVIVPAGIWLVSRLIPAALMQEFREQAMRKAYRPTSSKAAAVIILLWIVVASVGLWGLVRTTI